MKVLFILMRIDMASMNAGKAVAQGSHATSLFHVLMEDNLEHGQLEPEPEGDWAARETPVADAYLEWRRQAGGFGTVLTLGCTEEEMNRAVMYARQMRFHTGVVNDPTYPLRDGATTHFFPVDTCAWVFGDKEEMTAVLGWLDLHP